MVPLRLHRAFLVVLVIAAPLHQSVAALEQPSYGSGWRKPSEGRFLQIGADDWVSKIFPNVEEEGFYVEVGAHDGKYLSNSFTLDAVRGWRGICIDPNPNNFSNRTCTLERVAIDSKPGFVDFRLAGPVGGVEQSLTKHHMTVHRASLFRSKVVRVHADTLEGVLDRLGAPKYIHYLSLDVEGGEFNALKYFPFGKYEFGAITVEHNFEEHRRNCMRRLLSYHGYRVAAEVEFDDWFVRDGRYNSTAARAQHSPAFECDAPVQDNA